MKRHRHSPTFSRWRKRLNGWINNSPKERTTILQSITNSLKTYPPSARNFIASTPRITRRMLKRYCWVSDSNGKISTARQPISVEVGACVSSWLKCCLKTRTCCYLTSLPTTLTLIRFNGWRIFSWITEKLSSWSPTTGHLLTTSPPERSRSPWAVFTTTR